MALQISIGSFSFHRLLAAGKQDIFQYILDCKALGCTQLDPWNAHLSSLQSGDEIITAGTESERIFGVLVGGRRGIYRPRQESG